MALAAPRRQLRVKFFEADAEGWQRIVTINCIGAFLMTRLAVEPMIEKGWGRIVNVTTSFDTMLAQGFSAYGASKAALEAGSASFAKDLEGSGVTVNVLVPGGPTDTPGFFPHDRPRPPILLDPKVMEVPVVWLASAQSDGISGCRFIARDWDTKLPPSEAAARVRGADRLARFGAKRRRRARPSGVASTCRWAGCSPGTLVRATTDPPDTPAKRRPNEPIATCCSCACDPWAAVTRDRRDCRSSHRLHREDRHPRR